MSTKEDLEDDDNEEEEEEKKEKEEEEKTNIYLLDIFPTSLMWAHSSLCQLTDNKWIN